MLWRVVRISANGENLAETGLSIQFRKIRYIAFAVKYLENLNCLTNLNVFSDWQPLCLMLKRHETSIRHIENVTLWIS